MNKDSFIWKYLSIENHSEVENLKKLCLENLPNRHAFFRPLELGIKEFLGLKVNFTVLISVTPLYPYQIHTDYRADGLKLALNIPLRNCENSITEFYHCHENESQYSLTPLGIPYNNYPKENCAKITEFRLNQPVIFNTKIPHSVVSSSNRPRLAISIRFAEDPWHLVGL